MSSNPCDCDGVAQCPLVAAAVLPFVLPFSLLLDASSDNELDDDDPFIFSDPFESLPLLFSFLRLGNVGM